ncbi:class I SAM-dependent methyltransferase [Fluviispira multicolorata]|uniref:Methyltransferase domain-containing protein n=1 Tax=Fluviispira multicolorata TaxID=2654512 RepID=A0A833JAJ5_9BACT|nr:class I SAM-dependent methyltransferase [Fluviispira multicolorata]KAB8028011.1 methyltransferase domain-containing protein [Fluviispira multicolorata]
MKCRVCSKNIESIMSFGSMPIANGFLSLDKFKNEYFFELNTAFCMNCKMFQLVDQPDPKMMFHDSYAFFSSTSRKMEEYFKNVAEHFMNNYLRNTENAFVIEIGCNDGIMLKHISNRGIKHLGIEPSSNVAEVAKQNGVNAITSFFNEETAAYILESNNHADIIFAANVMCHIPDIHSVARSVNLLLKENGIFVFEDPYLGDVLQKTSYDQIYDEHVYLFSVHSITNAFGLNNLEVFHVEPQLTHGGSMRYYLCRRGSKDINISVTKQLKKEKELGLDKFQTFQKFKLNCEQNKNDLIKLLNKLKEDGKRVVGYAATSKSTTILNYCGIDSSLIEYISDTTPIKYGKFTPGSHIPVKSYEEFKKDKPDYAVLFAWNHSNEIFEKECDFLKNGGNWIVFVPEVKILNKETYS